MEKFGNYPRKVSFIRNNFLANFRTSNEQKNTSNNIFIKNQK